MNRSQDVVCYSVWAVIRGLDWTTKWRKNIIYLISWPLWPACPEMHLLEFVVETKECDGEGMLQESTADS